MNILGKGVDAIKTNVLQFDLNEKSTNIMQNVLLKNIIPGNYQPRKKGNITTESLQDLIASIKELGLLQPIIVRKTENEVYELIAGERRYRSALELNLQEIPCIIKTVNEKEAFAIALIENIQREQLSLQEEAEALLKLKDEYSLTVEQVAKTIGKPRTTIANLIRVASMLSPHGKLLWESGTVDYGHIRAVILLDHEKQNQILTYIADKKLSVRETEKLIKQDLFNELNAVKTTNSLKILIPTDITKKITDQFHEIYNKNIKIKEMNSGKIKILMEFDHVDAIFDYLKSQK